LVTKKRRKEVGTEGADGSGMKREMKNGRKSYNSFGDPKILT
jgi:hypothetical protein